MKNQKIILSLSSISLILTLILSGCKTKQKVLTEPDTKNVTQMTAFFFTDAGLSSLKEAVDAAHAKRQKIFTIINFPIKADQGNPIPYDKLLTNLKREVNHLVTNYDIDGLGIYISDHPHELIESMTVESMLLKPYLVNFVVWSNDNEYKKASECLKEGIVDLVVHDSKIERKTASIYEGQANLHLNLKKIKPEQVFKLDLSPMFPLSPGGRKVKVGQFEKSHTTDSDGCISFITTKIDTLNLSTEAGSVRISTADWFVPYRYVVNSDGKTSRKSLWVEFRRMPKENTDLNEFDLLCKTEYPAKVWINDEPVKQYKTGIFFKKIKLTEGANRVRATVMIQDSLSVFYEREFIYKKSEKSRALFPLWIDQKSFEPASEMEVLPEDILRVSFQGSRGQDGYVKVMPGK